MTDQLPILFLDTETTGLHTDRRPWEIAWIRREIDGTETERLIQISDVDLATAELKGLQVGRFHERYFRNIGVDQKPDNVEIDREFLAAHAVEEATRGAIIVGAVPNFDTETLAAMLRRHRLCPSWHYQLVDIETLAAGWLRAMPHSAPPRPAAAGSLNGSVRSRDAKGPRPRLRRYRSCDRCLRCASRAGPNQQ
ncbi:hypothetical protein F8M49_22160 [Rhodococcus zopfii]|uniref:Exonuclease domain-containing protein n=1 Tax=Rhodococcus zopfii TaxID=43772 RepID=A0ABU3WUX9_9NOCA|nr:hypothetical protein [Rhodococcus zopfii]